MFNTVEDLIEIELANPDDFLKVKETLTRIGIASKKEKILYQSCHILHKQGKYYIVHFKELFSLDGKPSNFSENDKFFDEKYFSTDFEKSKISKSHFFSKNIKIFKKSTFFEKIEKT